jgi:PhnB protein
VSAGGAEESSEISSGRRRSAGGGQGDAAGALAAPVGSGREGRGEETVAREEVRDVYAYLCVRDGAAAIDFYARLFGAREILRLDDPSGRVGHAELRIGPATVMLCDEHPELGILSPLAFGGTGISMHLHVENVDRLAARAAALGATVVRAPTDYGHGERQCRLRDPFGHEWLLGHRIEDVSEDEMKRRYEEEHGGVKGSDAT